MIDRRAMIGGFAALPLAAPLAAQQKRPLVAILSPARSDAAVIRLVNQPFKQALAGLGWDNARNIDVAERFAEGDLTRLPALAAELVAMRPHVLFTNTSLAAAAVAQATSTVPIVIGPAGEHVLVQLAGGSLARPTTNVTGFVLTSPEIDDKCIALLLEAVPSARRIGVLVNPRNPGQAGYPDSLQGSMQLTGKSLIRLEAEGRDDIGAALAHAATERIDALFVADDSHVAADPEVRGRILQFAASARVPIASSHLQFARVGAVLAMGPSIPALAVAAAGYVDRILRGAVPADLPIQRPTSFEVIANLKAARALGLAIPPTILARADEVIE